MPTIPIKDRFACAKFLSQFTLKDVLSALSETENFDWSQGFLYPTQGDSCPCPQIMEALVDVAGFTFTDAESWTEQFEAEYTYNHSDRRVRRLFWSYIINYFTQDIDIAHPFQEIVDNPSLWGGFVLQFWRYMEIHYGSNILKVANVYLGAEYDPLENYNGTENYTRDNSQNTNITTSGSSSMNIDGFNSDESSPQSDGESSSTTTGDAKDNTIHEEITRTRHGNLGITTSQQMIESELALRKFDFVNYVYSCMDQALLSSIY